MASMRNIAVLVGSLRQGSLNRKAARALARLAPEELRLGLVEIGALPLYNQDYDDKPPPAWVAFRREIKQADAVLFVTPEYNRSVPGVLKNAIDVGSRPYGESVWNAKPAAIMSVSPSSIGGFGANQHLRQCLVYLNMPPLQQPEAYIGGADILFDDQGNVLNDSTSEFLRKFITAFGRWIETTLPGA